MAHKKNCQCPPCCYRRGEDKGQAPRLSIRLNPEIRDYLLQHEDGARGVIERLVGEEMRAVGSSAVVAEAKQRKSEDRPDLVNGRPKISWLQVSDKSKVIETATGAPSALDLWATRFTHTLARSRIIHKLLRPVGLDWTNGRWAAQKLRLGYCSSMTSRTEADKKDLKKLGMLGPDGRDRLAGCLTVPYYSSNEQLVGFCGVRIRPGKKEREVITGAGSGLLLTGLDKDLVLVDGVREALTCFGVGVGAVQALDLLTPGWFPEFWSAGVRTVKLAVSDRERAERAAFELTRLGMECFWAPVDTDAESRVLIFGHSVTIEGILERGLIKLPAPREKVKKRAG